MAGAVAAGFTALAAHAEVTFLTQTRSVSGIGIEKRGTPTEPTFLEIPGSIAAPDFGPFNQTLMLGTLEPFVAKQNSSISTGLIFATGEAFATNAFVKNTKAASGEGFSKFEVEFSIDVATEFSLIGSVEAKSGLPFGNGIVVLEGPGLLLGFANIKDFKPLVELSEAGVLAPGAYKLWALAEAHDPGPPGATANSSFQFTFLVPSPTTMVGLVIAAGFAAPRRRRA